MMVDATYHLRRNQVYLTCRYALVDDTTYLHLLSGHEMGSRVKPKMSPELKGSILAYSQQ